MGLLPLFSWSSYTVLWLYILSRNFVSHPSTVDKTSSIDYVCSSLWSGTPATDLILSTWLLTIMQKHLTSIIWGFINCTELQNSVLKQYFLFPIRGYPWTSKLFCCSTYKCNFFFSLVNDVVSLYSQGTLFCVQFSDVIYSIHFSTTKSLKY